MERNIIKKNQSERFHLSRWSQFTQQGFAYTGLFKELDEDCNIVMENGVVYDPKSIVFIGEGEGKDN